MKHDESILLQSQFISGPPVSIHLVPLRLNAKVWMLYITNALQQSKAYTRNTHVAYMLIFYIADLT